MSVSPPAAAGTSRFLDLPALSALAHMRFTTRYRIEGAYSGRHQSRRQGSAGEFVDYREYSEGEDLRRLDWKVLGRSGRAYVRLYQDETNLVGLVALDTSGSMDFAGYAFGRADARDKSARAAASRSRVPQSKLEYGQYLATAFAHVIARGQDQVGLALVDNALEELIPPGGTSSHLSRIYGAIEGVRTRPSTKMGAGLRQLFERASRCGVLLLISDFLQEDTDEIFAMLRLFRHRRWEVVVLHLVHPDEEQLPDGVAYRFCGLEGDGEVAASPAEVRAAYAARFAAHRAAVRTLALAGDCDYHLVSTGIDYLQTLRKFLVARTG